MHQRSGNPFLLFFFIIVLLLPFFITDLPAQTILKSAIKGIILDQQTLAPLPGATITILNSNPLNGTTSDNEGHFKLGNIPIGKYLVVVTYVGYTAYTSEIITVNSSKESLLTVYLKETVLTTSEVEIRGDYHKYEAINKMATVSVRSFSVDETFRFPGSYNDPARMAANFAGVTSGLDNRNDIIVRGNSPMGLQWRIDDMEIPNPNHFAAVGTTGGPVTVLNNNLLSNSDFFTGAFPAQYGNTLSGIFDLRMRAGNNDRHEYWFQVGWNGLEFGAEGPFSKKHNASYLISYRYSPLQFLGWFNISLGVIPKYQDLNIKITLPTKNAGIFTLTGIGGLSYIELFDSWKDQSGWTFPDYGEDLANGSNLGVLGLSHQIFLTPSLRWKNQIYIVASKVYTKIDTFSNVQTTPSPWAGELTTEIKYSFSTQLMKKFSAKNSLDAGFFWDYFQMSFADSMMYKGEFMVNTNSRENMHFLRGFTQWQHRFSNEFSTTIGLYGSWLSLNNSWTAEPRLGFDWIIHKNHILTFGAGLYSQMQPRVFYFILTPFPDGTVQQFNKNLEFSRSLQVALGYDYRLTEDLHFKTELYGQYLFGIPTKPSLPAYALSNQGHEFFLDRQYGDSLINSATAFNYGVEFTFERFFKRNYYFLLTASLFNSTFYGMDHTTRNTAFNVNYALNAVGGYEFVIGKRKWGIMSFGLRATWAGGNPYIPYDEGATIASGEPMLDWTQAFEPRYPEYKRIAFRFGVKRNLPKLNMEFFIDLQYRTNFTNVYIQRIDPKTGEIRNYFNMGFFPMGTWRIQF